MAVYKTDYVVGEEVWRIIKVYNAELRIYVWAPRLFTIDKITITKTGISYHCYRYSEVGGSWMFGNRVLYRDRAEVDEVVATMNKKLLKE